MIPWIERSPYLHEDRIMLSNGRDGAARYVALRPDAWRGYVVLTGGADACGRGGLPCTHGGTRRRGCRCG